MAARKHHYVPVFYQNGFADSGGLVWIYDRVRKTCQHLPPKVVCRAEDFYAVRPDGAPRDRRIETDILSPIEGRAAPLIRKLECGERLSFEEMAHVSIFIGVQFTRVPSFSRAVNASVELMANEFLRIQFATPERARAALQRVAEHTGEPADVDPVSMVESIAQRRITIHATERPFLENMMHQAKSVAGLVAESQWIILLGPSNSAFITSDNPFMSLPPMDMDLATTGIGYGLPGVTNYFPLTKHTCLELRLGDYGYTYQNVDSRYVRTVNRNIAASSDRFIIGSSDRQMDRLVKDCGINQMEYSERYSLEVVLANDHESLVKFQRKHPPKYFYRE